MMQITISAVEGEMAIERYSAGDFIELVSWVNRDPERAFETGVKLVGLGLLLIFLAAIFSK